MTANLETPSLSEGVAETQPVVLSTHNETTKFADDTIGQGAQPVAQGSEFITGLIAGSSQTIVDFLERPSVVSYGSFTTADVGLLFIADAVELLSTNKKSKLQNIYTLKFDVQVTLQVNADRFQQGRYILAWLPTGGGTSPSIGGANLQWRNMHTCNLTKITQLPHVEIDLATQTHVTLTIPWTSIYPMATWSTNTTSFITGLGPVILMPYSKLDPGTGGSTTCGYTLWASFKNITIGSASFNQMASSREAAAMDVQPISRTLDKISKTTKILGEVPAIGGLMSTASWAAALAARAARVWGWSKPLALKAPERTDRKVMAFSAVSDVAAYAKPLGVLSENSVALPPPIPKNIDEMSIDFIKQVYAFAYSTTWTTGQVAGTTLFAVTTAPNAYTTFSKGLTYTPASFVSQQFERWRGTLKYRFKLVKTSFHRGRLLVAFYPGTTPADTAALAQSEPVYREVVDVSETNEFEVCCPYMLPAPWLQRNQQSGTLVVYVVDPLVAPTTVSSSVGVLIEHAGGSDFQVAVPVTWPYEPYAPSTAQMAEEYVATPCFELGPKSSSVNDRIPEYTIGESVKSIRQLIKRLWTYDHSKLIGGDSYIVIAPYVLEPVTQASGTGGAIQRTSYYSDFINLWSFAYAMNHGSMRYALSQNNTTLQSSTMTMATTAQSLNAALVQRVSRPLLTGFVTLNSSNIEGPIEFQTPVWCSTFGRSTPAQIASIGQNINVVVPQGSAETVTVFGDQTSYSSAASSIGFSRAAGEDFGFGVFVGVPPVVSRVTT